MLEARIHEGRIDLSLGHEGEVGQRARPVQFEDLAEEFLQVGLSQARTEEQQRSMAEHLREGAPEMRLAVRDAAVLRVVEHEFPREPLHDLRIAQLEWRSDVPLDRP